MADDASRAEARALLEPLREQNLASSSRLRFAPDLDLFTMPEGVGVQVRGGEHPLIIRGRLADTGLRYLISQLDGERTLESVISDAPADVPQVMLVRLLDLVHQRRLLVRSDDRRMPGMLAGEDGETLRRQALYWGRHLSHSAGAASGTAVQDRIAGARIILLGTGMFGVATYDLLARSGCTEIRILDWNDAGFLLDTVAAGPLRPRAAVHLTTTAVDRVANEVRQWADDADLVVTATRDAPRALFHRINRIALGTRIPWLHGNVNGSTAEVGPLVLPYESGCYRCMELRRASVDASAIEEYLYQERLAAERNAAESVPIGESIWAATLVASLLVGEVIRVVSQIAPPTLVNTVIQVRPVSGDLQANTFLRVPRCPDCYPGEIAAAPVEGGAMGRTP
jgi:bacteriocin biosynthesis cyclodehydratase domain-containing protein